MEENIKRKGGKLFHYEAAEKARSLGFVFIGLYTYNRIPLRVRCLAHGEIHNARYDNLIAGKGLKCCRCAKQKARSDSMNSKFAAIYDERIKGNGKLIRIDPYVDRKTPIRHRCLIHDEVFFTTPMSALLGGGLGCCQREASLKENERRSKKSARDLTNDLKTKNPNVVWVGGEYKNNRFKLDFHCLIHDEIHPAAPSSVKQGLGLKCCAREARRKSGLKMGPLNGKLVDNVWRALLDKLENKGFAYLYFYESPANGWNKFGISKVLEQRKAAGKYGQQLIKPHFFADRSDAVLVEQAYKYGWGVSPPVELRKWEGKGEVTQMQPEEFEEIIDDLEVKLLELGRWKFAEEYCDPKEVIIAKKTLSSQNSSI